MDKEKLQNYSWLINARYKNQTLLFKIYKHIDCEMDEVDRKVYNLLTGAAFSLWRAAFLVIPSRQPDEIRRHSEFILDKLIADNSLTYHQDIMSREWMGGYYMNNARHRIVQAKVDLCKANKDKFEINCSAIENERLSYSGDLLEHWDYLHGLTSQIFEEHYGKRFDRK